MPYSLNIFNGFFVVLDEDGAEKFNCPVNGARYFPDFESQTISFGYGESEQLFGGTKFSYMINGVIQLQEGRPLQSPPVDFVSFNTVVGWCRLRLGFNPANFTFPAGSIEYQTARVINDVSEFNVEAGEIVSDAPVIHYIIDNPLLDLGELYFRGNPGQLIIVSALAPGGARMIGDLDNYTMFQGNGSLYLFDIALGTAGLNSSVMSLENEPGGRNLVYIEKVTFEGCTSLGTLTNYQVIWQSGRIIACGDGLTFDGALSAGFSIREVGVESTFGTLFQATSAYRSLGTSYLQQVRAELSGNTFLSFIPANFPNDNSFYVRDNEIFGSGTFAAGITASDIACNWFCNHGNLAQNTKVGTFAINQTALQTPGVGVGTWTKAISDFLFLRNDWFSIDGLGGATYLSTTPLRLTIHASISIRGQANVSYIVGIGITPNGGGLNIIQFNRATTSITVGATYESENNAFLVEHLFQEGDHIDIYFQKTGVSSDPYLLDGSSILTKE